MRIKLTLQYDGTPYKGWQRQKYTQHTVQQVVEDALQKVCNHHVTVYASGRTDVGVHALGQVVHFDTDSKRDTDQIVSGCNHFLPCTVRVENATVVDYDFHARYSAKSKTYMYNFYCGTESVMLHNRAWYCKELDAASMSQACQILVGTHNFGSFMGAGGNAHTTVRKVIDCTIYTKKCPTTQNPLIILQISAKGFLYNMVRRIAGLLKKIGQHELPIQAVVQALQTIDPEYTKLVAPACGLYLAKVEYGQPSLALTL